MKEVTQEQFEKYFYANPHKLSKSKFCQMLGLCKQFDECLRKEYKMTLNDIEDPLKHFNPVNNSYGLVLSNHL